MHYPAGLTARPTDVRPLEVDARSAPPFELDVASITGADARTAATVVTSLSVIAEQQPGPATSWATLRLGVSYVLFGRRRRR